MTASPSPMASLSADEIRSIVGDIDDARLARVEALAPTRAELEAAVAWIAGGDDEMHKERRALAGKTAEVFELLTTDLPPDENR